MEQKIFNYSWISYYDIECNKEKTGLIFRLLSFKDNGIISTFGFS